MNPDFVNLVIEKILKDVSFKDEYLARVLLAHALKVVATELSFKQNGTNYLFRSDLIQISNSLSN
jgi:hypothetical protein